MNPQPPKPSTNHPKEETANQQIDDSGLKEHADTLRKDLQTKEGIVLPPDTMTISQVRLAIANVRKAALTNNDIPDIRMPRYVLTDDGKLYFDTMDPVEGAMLRKIIKTGKMPGVLDMDRAHKAQDKRMARSDKRFELVKDG